MSEGRFHFELVGPEFLLTYNEVKMVVISSVEGDFGVLPRHVPMISMLRPGTVELYLHKEGKKRIFVRDGFAEVLAGDVTVLAEDIVMLEEVDSGELAQLIQNAREDFADARDEDEEMLARVRTTLERLEQIERALGTE